MRALSLQAMARVGILAGRAVAGGAAICAQAPAGPQPTSPGQDNTAPAQKPSTPQQQKPQEAGVSISVEVPVVTLDVVAATQNGDIIPGLKKENFRVLEDGQPQTITSFGPTDAPITIVALNSISTTIVIGASVGPKLVMVCGCPSSSTRKFSFLSPGMATSFLGLKRRISGCWRMGSHKPSRALGRRMRRLR